MKILLIHTLYKEKGGEDIVVSNESELLSENGYDVKVLYFDNRQSTARNLIMLPFNVVAYRQVVREINSFKPDLIHLHNLHFAASPSVIWAAKRNRVPMVATLHNYRLLCPSGTLFHNNDLYYNSLYSSFPWKAVKDKVYRGSALLTFWLALVMWLHKKMGTFGLISRYLALNEKSRDIFLASRLKFTEEQVIVKPNYVRCQNSSNPETPASRQSRFLFIGRLSPEKGIDVLVKTFAANGLPLTIIGDGPLRNEIERLQQHNPLVHWLGYQAKEVIDKELSQCTALIVPSVCLEGMPLTLVEAFALSTPVIASKLGGMATIVIHNSNGLLFTPNDATSLNEQVNKWLAFTQEEKNHFSIEARKSWERKYTPERNLAVLSSIYRDVTEEKKGTVFLLNKPVR